MTTFPSSSPAPELTWQDKKRIGDALGHHIPESGWLEVLTWEGWQPDVLGEVIPWLQLNTMSWAATWNDGYEPWWSGDDDDINELHFLPRISIFEGAVCRLMLHVLEATDGR